MALLDSMWRRRDQLVMIKNIYIGILLPHQFRHRISLRLQWSYWQLLMISSCVHHVESRSDAVWSDRELLVSQLLCLCSFVMGVCGSKSVSGGKKSSVSKPKEKSKPNFGRDPNLNPKDFMVKEKTDECIYRAPGYNIIHTLCMHCCAFPIVISITRPAGKMLLAAVTPTSRTTSFCYTMIFLSITTGR